MRKLVLCLAVVVVLVASLLAGPALAVNDPFAPGDDCAAADEAIGHPAGPREQSDVASPPFSLNNPGESTGAKAGERSKATDHCANAQP